MYSWEIDQLLKLRNYLLDAEEYLKICSESPQITRVKYDPFNNTFYIETSDDYKWTFKVKRREK